MLVLQDIIAAQNRIAPYVVRTPLLRIPALDMPLGCQVYLKYEGFQIMGAFKIRGAMNKALTLTPEELKCGLVCSSSGNHAQGVACAAQQLGAKSLIVMPADVNSVKLAGVAAFGGKVELMDASSSVRQARVEQLSREMGMVNIHAYADPWVAAGQGTIGLEITADLPDVAAVAVPIGGGGLIGGIATAVKGTSSYAKIVGVEPAGAPRYGKSREAGHPVALDSTDTLADATRTDKAHPFNFEIIEDKVDQLCTVEDASILKALKLLLDKAKLVAEPSSAMPVAAALEGKLSVGPKDKVVFVITSGNTDPALIAHLMKKDMA